VVLLKAAVPTPLLATVIVKAEDLTTALVVVDSGVPFPVTVCESTIVTVTVPES